MRKVFIICNVASGFLLQTRFSKLECCLVKGECMKKILAVLLSSALAVCALCFVGCQQKQEEAPAASDDKMTVSDNTGPFYALLVGNDSRTGTVEINKDMYADGSARSDVMMLVRVDPGTHQIGLVTIPRDTQAEVDGTVCKINDAYRTGGIEAAVDQAELLTGVRIDYYCDLGFVTFEKFIDDIGGVTVNVPIPMSLVDIVSGDKISLEAGTQDLDGAEALVLARTRKAYEAEGMEAVRQMQNRQIVQNIIVAAAADPDKVEFYVDALLANADTNFDRDILVSLVTNFANNADAISFVSGTGPYDGEVMDRYGGIWLAYRDTDTWAKVIGAVEAGQDPTAIVPLPAVRAA